MSTEASRPFRLSRKDNAAVYTCYGYDAFHRLLGLDTSNSTQCTGFVYDSATPPNGVSVSNTKGRLINAYTNSACNGRASLVTDRWLGYSPRGEVTDIYSSTPNSNGYYHVTKSYWPHGALQSLGGIPGVPTIYYGASDASGLDGEGRVTKVTASSGGNLVTAVTYGGTGQPVGALIQVTYGSNDFDNFSYDPNTGRMTGYQFNVGTSGLAVVGTLGWNSDGTLQTLNITDPFNSANSQTCNYTYDALGRLGGQDASGYSVNCGSTWAQTFTFDPFGNITKSGSISWLPTYASPTNNQYKSGWNGITYDNDGNLTYDTFHNYQWDANGHMIGILDGTYQSTQTFDALGNMVEQSIPSASWLTQFLYDADGTKLGYASAQAPGWTWIPLPGGGNAIYVNGSLQNYWHADWLGSARFGSTPSRTLYSDTAYAPYGEAYAGTGHSYQSFAGMKQSLASDVFDTTFREYHPIQGRWISPDPAGLAAVDPSNPQTWNRYAYVNNNPLSKVDPLGLDDGDPWGFQPYDPPSPWNCYGDISCFTPCDFIICVPEGGAGGGGPHHGGGGPAPSSGPQHGPWPGNETTGLPQLPTQPLSLGDLLGMTPGIQGLVAGVDDALEIGLVIRVVVYAAALAAEAYGVYKAAQIGASLGKGFPSIADLQKNCKAGRFITEPSRSKPGWTSEEQEYICSNGAVYTVHCLVSPTRASESCHVRPGPPKGGE